MTIKKGKIEHAMDKAMMVIFIVVCISILGVSFLTYYQYKNDIEKYVKQDFTDAEDINHNSSYTPLISKEGYIIIDGKPYIPDKQAKDFSFTDALGLGWTIFNQEVISIDNTNSTIFSNNSIVIVACVMFFIYWIFLLFLFEKERNNIVSTNITDEEILDKYNPLIAGCLEGNRNVVHSDIPAVLLGLINKKIIDLELKPVNDRENLYKYILKRNRGNEANIGMDEVERYVHLWIFGTGLDEKDEVELTDAARYISYDEEYDSKLKELNKLAKKKLNEIGANKNKVPLFIRILNTLVFVSTICLFLYTVWFGLVKFSFGRMDMVLIYFGIILFSLLMPVVIFLTYSGIFAFVQMKRIGKIFMNKVAKREVVKVTFLVLLVFITMLVATNIFSINPAIIPYEILFCITLLIMKTDNAMIQNDEEILVDYNRLKMIKEKLKDYTILDKRNIEDVVLWEKYMTYAVAFGVAEKVIGDTDEAYKRVKVEKEYLLKLIIDTTKAFIEVNF